MKKLIVILFLFSFALQAQNDFKFAGFKVQEDKLNHFGAGFMIGSVSNLVAYDVLKDTNLKPWQSKTISFVFGAGVGILAGHLKEKHDEKNNKQYSKSDFNTTLYGSLCGSLTIRLFIWNSIPKSKVSIEDLWLLENSN